MTIVQITYDIESKLKNSNFSSSFIKNCLNSRFLAIKIIDSEIAGASFVGGIMNVNGIETIEKFRGQGIAKQLLSEIINESKKRNISFLLGAFKPSNIISIKMHTEIGYTPIFSFYYNKNEGREIVVILPFNKKGKLILKLLKFFNTRIGNSIFAIILMTSRPFLKHIITFDQTIMPQIDFIKSISNFEKI